MNYKRNKKYFSQENKTYPIVVSAFMIAIGFIMVVFLASTRGINGGIMRIIGLPVLSVGVLWMTTVFAVTIKDSELDESLKGLDESFKNDFGNKFIKTDVRRFKNEQRYGRPGEDRHSEPVFFETYYFDDEKALVKRGGDGRERSSVYSISGFMLRPASICVGERYVNLVEDGVTDSFKEIAYLDLSGAEYIDSKSGIVYEGKTPYRHIVLKMPDGSVAADFPILADADADSYLSEISVRIKRAAENANNNNI